MPEPYPEVMGIARVCNEEVADSGQCYICYWPTHDLDLSFECWLCFPICYVVLWDEYFDHCAQISGMSKEKRRVMLHVAFDEDGRAWFPLSAFESELAANIKTCRQCQQSPLQFLLADESLAVWECESCSGILLVNDDEETLNFFIKKVSDDN